MKKTIISLFIFFLASFDIHSENINSEDFEDVIYIPDNKLPYEFLLIMEYLANIPKDIAQKLTYQQHVKEIDSFLLSLELKDAFFVIKSEIYKAILKNLPKPENQKEISPNAYQNNDKDTYKKSNLTKLEAILHNDTLNPYSMWLLNAIKDDFVFLTTQTAYGPYVLQKSANTPITEAPLLSFERRLNFILPFVDYFINVEPKDWGPFLTKIAFDALKRIVVAGTYQAQFSKFQGELAPILPQELSPTLSSESSESLKLQAKSDTQNLAKTELRFFTKRNAIIPSKEIIAPTPAAVSSEAIVDKIIENQENQNSINQEKKSLEAKWVPKDENLFPTPDPNYIPPKTLPIPVDDWD